MYDYNIISNGNVRENIAVYCYRERKNNIQETKKKINYTASKNIYYV